MPQGPPIPLRNRILGLVALAAGVTYLDRVCISVATPAIMRDLHLDKIHMGYAFGVFSIAYGLAEMPTGWLTDRLGQRRMLTWIVALWSLFTALTGIVRGFWSLIIVRSLFGASEAGAFPSLARAIGHWFHPTDRGRANGVMWMGARIGASLAPLLATLFIGWFGWRIPFPIFGAVGGAWCVLFWKTYRDNPAQHPAATAADRVYIQKNLSSPGTSHGGSAAAPWKAMFLSRNLWAIFGMYAATSYGFWFLLTWLPTYLIQQHGVSPERAGFYAALPLGVGAVSAFSGGALSDLLVRRLGSLMWGRRIVGLGGYSDRRLRICGCRLRGERLPRHSLPDAGGNRFGPHHADRLGSLSGGGRRVRRHGLGIYEYRVLRHGISLASRGGVGLHQVPII